MQNYGDGAAPTSGPAWHVVRIEDTTAYQPGKGALRVKRIYWQLFDGTESYEDFPAATFDLGKAEAKIDASAMVLYKALQLKGAEVEYPKG